MKNSVVLITILTFGSLAFADKKVFDAISDVAQVGNGSTSVGTYKKSLSKKEVEELGFAELKEERWEGCGPYKRNKGRRAAIKQIAELEADQDVDQVTAKLEALYKRKKIKAIVHEASKEDVSCSLDYFNIYGNDGHVLRLRYELND